MAIAFFTVATADDCYSHLIIAAGKPSISHLLNSEQKIQTWLYEKVCLESVECQNAKRKVRDIPVYAR